MDVVKGLGGWFAVILVIVLLVVGQMSDGVIRKGAWAVGAIILAIAAINTLSYE